MSTQPLRQAIASARAVMANVAPDQMQAQTPCASWKVADLVNHLVDAQVFFAASLTGEKPSEEKTNWADGDFLTAFDEKAEACAQAFEADGALDQTLQMPFGEMPARAWLGLATTDIFTHAWDAAKATGQSTDLNPELASALLAQSKQSMSDSFRGPEGAPFGPEQAAPEGAPVADQLAAFLGRTV